METTLKRYQMIAALVFFVALPLLAYGTDNFPRQAVYKEALSIVTLLAFFSTVLQFFLSRANAGTVKLFKAARLISRHKLFGYLASSLLLLHPFTIILPRFFEAGVTPTDALITLLTSFHSKGVLLGMVAYLLLLFLAILSLLRQRLPFSYRTWRTIHGLTSVAFLFTASFHVIILGRHSSLLMSLLIAVLALIAISLLLRLYLINFRELKYGTTER